MTNSELKSQEAIWKPEQADKTLYDLYFLNGKNLPFKARKDSWKRYEYITVVQIQPWLGKNSFVMAVYSASPYKEPLKRSDAEKPVWRIVKEIQGEAEIEII